MKQEPSFVQLNIDNKLEGKKLDIKVSGHAGVWEWSGGIFLGRHSYALGTAG